MADPKRDVPKDGEECYHCGRGGAGIAKMREHCAARDGQCEIYLAKIADMKHKIEEAMRANGLRVNPDRAERWLASALAGGPMRRKDD